VIPTAEAPAVAGESTRLVPRHVVLLLALLAAALVIYAIPAGERALWNQDEARVGLLAEDTLRHGLRLPARVRGEAYLNKPPLYFWSVALVSWPTGRISDLTAPIPSLIAALATLLGTFAMGRMLGGALTGFVALAILGTSPGFFLHSHQVLPDMMLAAWTTWMLYFLLAVLREERLRVRLLVGFYGCFAGALWTKGSPALLALPSCIAAALAMRGWRSLRGLRPLLGCAAVAVVMLPWAVPYALTPGRASGQTISVATALSWYLDRYDRVSSIPLTGGFIWFLPWTLWLVPLVWWWWTTSRVARETWRPLAAWTLMAVGLLALSVQQRPRYLLCVYPVFALLVAAALTAQDSGTRALRRLTGALVVGLGAFCLLAGAWIVSRSLQPNRLTPFTSMIDVSREGPLLIALMLPALAVALWELWSQGRPGHSVLWVTAGMAAVLLVEAWVYPARLTEQMDIHAFAATGRPALVKGKGGLPVIGFPDANLAFDLYFQYPFEETFDQTEIVRTLERPASRTLLLRTTAWGAFRTAAHGSWCQIAQAGSGARAYVLVGPCR
jgi:4-amino-4-deoxy-L-arabinose transferase-like glycosyltransferase